MTEEERCAHMLADLNNGHMKEEVFLLEGLMEKVQTVHGQHLKQI